mgnify:CR=1 FL=1
MKLLKQILTVTLLFQSTISFSQKDTTFARINKLPDNSTKIFTWINTANEISESDPKKALDYSEESLKLSLTLKNVRGEAYAYN